MNEAEILLNSYGITMQQASSFIIDNIDNIAYIHDVAKDYHVTNDMLAQILQDEFPGLTGEAVANYFAQKGIDSSDLGGTSPSIPVVDDSNDQNDQSTDIGIGFPLRLITKSTYTYFDNDTGQSNQTVINVKYTYNHNTGELRDDNPINPTTYKYNEDGMLLSSYSTEEGKKEFTYDEYGRLLKEQDTYSENSEEITTYTYDDKNGFVTIKLVDTLSGTQATGQGALDATHMYIEQINWDIESDGIVDEAEYYTYDQYGDILTQKVDSNMDGQIDYQFSYEWGLFT